MKKFMTIALAAALMFAMAGQASATALETSGEFRARYWFLDNYFASGKNTEFWDQRLRLNLVWPVAEGVKVSARADLMEGQWGDNLISEVLPATTPRTFTAAANSRPAVAWDQINLSFVVPATPLTVIVGRQGTTWGTGIFVAEDNRDRFRVNAKFADTTVFYTFDKYREVGALHDTLSLDDRSQHSFGAVSKLAGWNVGGIFGMILNKTVVDVDSKIYALGVYAIGKAGMADVKAEVVTGWGKDDLKVGQDVDHEILIGYLGVSTPAGPVTVGAELAYAKGDDPKTLDKNEGRLGFDYQSPFWGIILFNKLDYDGYAGTSVFAAGDAGDSGFGNAMGGKLTVSGSPMKGLTLVGAALYATRDKVAAGVKKPLGTEIDVLAIYDISPSVSLTLGGGYLMVGDFFKGKQGAAAGKKPDNPLGMMAAFTTKF